MSIVSLTNSTVNRGGQRDDTPPPPAPFVPTQQFKLHRFCFFGQGRCVSEKVNLGWPSRLGSSGIRAEILWSEEPPSSEIPVGLTSKGGRRDHLCQEFCSLASGLHSWPQRSWLNITDSFSLLSSENQDSNLMLPPLNLFQSSWQSKPITTQTLSHPPRVIFKEGGVQRAQIKTSSQRLTNTLERTGVAPVWEGAPGVARVSAFAKKKKKSSKHKDTGQILNFLWCQPRWHVLLVEVGVGRAGCLYIVRSTTPMYKNKSEKSHSLKWFKVNQLLRRSKHFQCVLASSNQVKTLVSSQ